MRAREPRVFLARHKYAWWSLSIHFSMNMFLDFAADDQRIVMYYSWKAHEKFPIQMTQNNKHNKWAEILDFQPKLLWRTPT